MIRKISSVVLFSLAVVGLMLAPKPKSDRIYAQFQTTAPPGFAAIGTNAAPPTVIGNGGAVTNPASNFLLLVQGSTVYFNSSAQTIGQSSIQLAANTTYEIVWNGVQEQLYAKTAVTGPGSPSPNQPGVPSTILAPISGLEIPLALVVCGTTNCGNTANGSITDQRPLANFPGAGMPLNTVAFANLVTTNVSNGTVIYCDTCAVASSPCTGSSTGALAIRVNGAWRCQ